MAYFVAKELHMRPLDILTKWNTEELLVAYGHYVNSHTNEYIETVPEKEWAKHKPPLTWLDRWGVLFVTQDQMAEITEDEEQTAKDTQNQMDIADAAKILFGG